MLQNTLRWRELIAEYGRLARLDVGTPQARGQRFNGVIAELLQCWDIEAHAGDRSKGEIDVAFTADGVRYILEAKWEKTKADTGHVAKLQKRVRQRLGGTHGLFLSMAGYSPEALKDVGDGERLEVILLDRSHWEAMLSGLVPPQELLHLASEHASFTGEAYATLPELFTTRVKAPTLTFAADADSDSIVESAAPECSAMTLLTGIDSDQLGIAYDAPNGLLLTTSTAILRADLDKQTSAIAVPITRAHRNPLRLPDGSILFIRAHGVARYHDGDVTCVAGGSVGNSCLFPSLDGRTWLLDNGDLTGTVAPSVTEIGHSLGSEVRRDIDYPPAEATNAAWLTDDTILVLGSRGLSKIGTSDPSPATSPSPVSNPMGLSPLDPSRVLIAGDGVTVAVADTGTGESGELLRLALRGSITELTRSDDSTHFLAAYDRKVGAMRWNVLRLSVDRPANLLGDAPTRTPRTADNSPTSETTAPNVQRKPSGH